MAQQTKDMNSKNAGSDIIDLILEDHKPLKKLLKVLKGEAKFEDKFIAFQEFAPLLTMHAKPEEKTLYVAMKKQEDMRQDGYEGDVEHGLADQMVEEIKRTENDDDLWTARVKVLAELVEHHIKEEEEDMLPEYRKESDKEERIQLGANYLTLRQELADREGNDAPREADLALMKKTEDQASASKQPRH